MLCKTNTFLLHAQMDHNIRKAVSGDATVGHIIGG